jgi:large subunit ribosomal protein L31
MKTDIHPDYHPVVFLDISTGEEYLTRSTLTSDERREIDGIDTYVIRVEISASSHPFFTGEQRIIDTAGQVERFRRRYASNEQAADSDPSAEQTDAATNTSDG